MIELVSRLNAGLMGPRHLSRLQQLETVTIPYRGPLGTRNLNDVREIGLHGQISTPDATTARNYPEEIAGALEVLVLDPNTSPYPIVAQRYTTNSNDQRLYMRRGGAAGAWSNWIQIAQFNALPPVGSLVRLPYNQVISFPSNYLLADNSVLSIAAYPELYALFGHAHFFPYVSEAIVNSPTLSSSVYSLNGLIFAFATGSSGTRGMYLVNQTLLTTTLLVDHTAAGQITDSAYDPVNSMYFFSCSNSSQGLAYSSNGTAWSITTSTGAFGTTTNRVDSCAAGKGLVAILSYASSGTTYQVCVTQSNTPTGTWSVSNNLPDKNSATFSYLRYDPDSDVFIAFGSNGIFTAPAINGVLTWTQRASFLATGNWLSSNKINGYWYFRTNISVYRSSDGLSWQDVTSNFSSWAMDVGSTSTMSLKIFGDGTRLYKADAQRIMRSFDNGNTWNFVAAVSDVYGNAAQVRIAPNDVRLINYDVITSISSSRSDTFMDNAGNIWSVAASPAVRLFKVEKMYDYATQFALPRSDNAIVRVK